MELFAVKKKISATFFQPGASAQLQLVFLEISVSVKFVHNKLFLEITYNPKVKIIFLMDVLFRVFKLPHRTHGLSKKTGTS